MTRTSNRYRVCASKRGYKPGAESDLDLAVLADGNSLCGRKLDILAELAKNGFCNVDLVILPSDDVVLQYEAVRLNRIVYQRPDFDGASVFPLFVRRYLVSIHKPAFLSSAAKQKTHGVAPNAAGSVSDRR